MNDNTQTFCNMIRNRSEENEQAIKSFSNPHGVLSPALSILRQELDSMVRVIYLLSIRDLEERNRLIGSTLNGEHWKLQTPNDKWRKVTDRDMVDLAQHLQGWTQSVYKFGCAFTHLSDYHNHISENPFEKLDESERQDILSHMRYYHGGPCHDNPDMEELARFLPDVFRKIRSNLESYIKNLEEDKVLDE